MAAKLVKLTFEVTGKFPFPVDMLRYDRCTPFQESDSATIESSINMHNEQPEGYTVTLLHVGEARWCPTDARWKSRCWGVVRGSVKPVV